jgi:hypothetical protein
MPRPLKASRGTANVLHAMSVYGEDQADAGGLGKPALRSCGTARRQFNRDPPGERDGRMSLETAV